jgi:hypothetical protein
LRKLSVTEAAIERAAADVIGSRSSLPSAISKPWYIVLPESSVASLCEIASFVALAAVFFVLPFELAFVDGPNVPDPTDGLYIFNRIIDLVFTIDITITFFTAIPTADEDDDDAAEEDEATTSLLYAQCSTWTRKSAC